MEQRDVQYIVFWSLAATVAAYFLGLGMSAAFLFSLSLVGLALAERRESAPYAVGSVFLALAFAVYFGMSAAFIGQLFFSCLLFLLLPFILLEARKRLKK